MFFNKQQYDKASFILESENAKLSSLNSKELKNLPVVWSYYSGKIEGNTYTYVETEALLIDGITSPKSYEDARMLKNLHNTFTTTLREIQEGNPFTIDWQTLMSIHSELTNGLVQDKERGLLRERPVKISGTNYTPPATEKEIRESLEEVLKNQQRIENPIERAIYLHCNIARIQPFIDGNKRTSRLVESMMMMQNDLVPTYSTKGEDILDYRNGLVHFYETQDYSKYVDYVLNKQISRINSLALPGEKRYNLKKKDNRINQELVRAEKKGKSKGMSM